MRLLLLDTPNKNLQELFPGQFWKGKRCLELGSGCGLVGIVAWLLGADVTLTDMQQALPHTEKCVNENVSRLLKEQGATALLDLDPSRIRVTPYLWGTDTACLGQTFDIILGSDIVYQPELSKDLIKTFHKVFQPHTKLLLSYKPRGLGEDNLFTMLRQMSYSIDTIPGSQHPADFMNSNYEIIHVRR